MGANCGDCNSGWHDQQSTFGGMVPAGVTPIMRPQWTPNLPQRKP